MIISSEVIIEGSYNYYQENKLYSLENFKLSRRVESNAMFFEAEILSRMETGEFLKIIVFYELNASMTPCAMRIEKSLGDKYSLETFEVNTNALELTYSFTNNQETKTITKHHPAKCYLSSPAVCTSAVFSLSKKFDTTTRTPVTLVTGHHSWKASEAHPIESTIYTEFNNRETIDLHLNGQELQGQCLSLYSNDLMSITRQESKVEMMLSKHYSIPYVLYDDKVRVEIKYLYNCPT